MKQFPPPWRGTVAVADRLQNVRDFSRTYCELALQDPHLQKTVRTAVERRLRKLDKEAGKLAPRELVALVKLSAGPKHIYKTERRWNTYQSVYRLKLCFRRRISLNTFEYVINDAGIERLAQERAR